MIRNQGVVVVLNEDSLGAIDVKNYDDGATAAGDVGESFAGHPAQTDATCAPSYLLMGKFKSVINDVVVGLRNPLNVYDVDDYIAVAEECLKELRTIKVERRIESRRANVNHRGANLASPSARDPSLPGNARDAATDDAVTTERSSTPKGSQQLRNYKAALLRQKKMSPKCHPTVAAAPAATTGSTPAAPTVAVKPDTTSRELVEVARHTSALRAEERQRQAEERRLDDLQGIRQRSEKGEERTQRAKARREEAERRTRTVTQERQEHGVRRAEEARQQTLEKVQRAHSRVDEVRLTNDLRQQTKALLIDKKMSDAEHNQEQIREERQKVAVERQEAAAAVAERRRNLSQERAERQQQREQQRAESLRRVEEQKQQKLEEKQQKAEEWEKKVHQHHKDTTAEAEALTRKTEEKLQQSEKFREEQRERLQQRRKAQEQKQRETRERKEAAAAVGVAEGAAAAKSRYRVLVAPLPSLEEEQLVQRVAKLTSAAARQGKTFTDNYQKECLSSTRDLNRSKLRPAFSRLSAALSASPPSLSQCRQPLNDICACAMTDIDHQFVRYFNMFEWIGRFIVDGRKAQEYSTVKLSVDWLRDVLADATEGKENAIYFVRSGGVLCLAGAVREEAQQQRQGSDSVLGSMLAVITFCLERVCAEAQTSVRLAAVRDQLLAEFETVGLERVCLSILRGCSADSEADSVLLYYALRVVNTQLSVFARRKGDVRFPWFQHVAMALLTLLQAILTPDGVSLQENAKRMNSVRVAILFSVFRALNTLARWQLVSLQALLHDPASAPAGSASGSVSTTFAASAMSATLVKQSSALSAAAIASAEASTVQLSRMELFHVLNSFFTYIHSHSEDLESIQTTEEVVTASTGEAAAAGVGLSSFEDALRCGITLPSVPPLPALRRSVDGVAATGGYHLRAALHECILLVGYLCLDDSALQEMLSWGKSKTLLGNMLNVLPVQYFTTARHILFPTLLAAVCHSERNLLIARDEMELAQLSHFITEEYEALSKKAKAYAQEHHRELRAFRMANDPHRFLLESTKGKSWAQMDDDDIVQPPSPRSIHSVSSTPMLEKDRLCKGLRVTGLSAVNMFRIERRLPISYWPGVMEELGTVVVKSK